MDTSEQYIEMCGCEEIQGQWKLREGDLVYWPSHPENIELFSDYDADAWTIEEIKKEHGGGVWLPRQDQLQDMIFVESDGLQTICNALYEFSISTFVGGIIINGTMEQLLLSYVMYYKFNKKWTGEKWEA